MISPGAWGGLHTGSTAQNPKVGASPELKIHQKSIKKKSENFGPKNSKKSEILRRIWDGLGVILGRFGGIFGPISKSLKFESSELKN